MSKLRVESVLVVEDELLTALSYAVIYRSCGLKKVEIATTVEQAESIFQTLKPDMVLMDIRLRSNYEGLNLARKFLETDSELKVVFISGYDISDVQELISQMKMELIVKPVDESQLKKLLI